MWIIAVLAPGAFVFAAWMLWLLFNYLIAKRYGLEGLKVTPRVAEAFHSRDWMSAVCRHVAQLPSSEGDDSYGRLASQPKMPGHGSD